MQIFHATVETTRLVTLGQIIQLLSHSAHDDVDVAKNGTC